MDEAMAVLDNIIPENALQTDTLNFLKGWAHYSQKELELSNIFLTRVSDASPFYYKSNFFAAYNYAYIGHTGESRRLLGNINGTESEIFKAMQNFQFAGISLLERRLEDFNTHSADFSGSYAVFAREEAKLLEYYERIKNQPDRSPVLAGFLSAAVPGLGKFYAGKPAEAISGLLYVGAMMGVTYDFYNRLGNAHPLFWLSAGITGIFYAGNIWGSVAAVNRTKQEFNYEMDQRILLDIHIPLRNLFP